MADQWEFPKQVNYLNNVWRVGSIRNMIYKNKKYRALEDLPIKQKFKKYVHMYALLTEFLKLVFKNTHFSSFC